MHQQVKLASYRDLKVWQLSVDLVTRIYRFTKGYPQSERFGLISQTERAAVSIPANIAEGHARDSTKEFLHHISFAFGSLAELETLLYVAKQLSYLDSKSLDELLVTCDQIGKMLRGLQKSLKSKLRRND
jgi:four helix bundle protein